LPGYLYGEGTVEDREKIQAHARDCPDCRKLLDEMTATVSLVRGEGETHFSAEEMAALRTKVRQEVAGTESIPVRLSDRSRLRFFSRPLLYPAAGALVAASIIAMIIFRPADRPEYIGPAAPDQADELVTMTETVEAEYDSVDELCREMEELQRQFLDEPDGGSEADSRSGRLSFSA